MVEVENKYLDMIKNILNIKDKNVCFVNNNDTVIISKGDIFLKDIIDFNYQLNNEKKTIKFENINFYDECNITSVLNKYFHLDYHFKDCIFHDKFIFNNQIFNNIKFENTEFKNKVCFKKTQFIEGNIKFIGVTFDEFVDFSNAVFGNTNSKKFEIYFKGTKFKKGIKLKNINKQKYFYTAILFSNIEFNQELDLSKCYFYNALEFNECIFNEKVSFYKSIFYKHNFQNKSKGINVTKFTASKFKKDVNFKNVEFNTIASFIGVQFKRIARFNSSVFNNKALFKQAVFSYECTFSHSVFNDAAKFENAKFFKSTYFNRSIFNKKTLFCSAIFKDVINFYFSIFKDVVNFSSCVFEKANFVNMIGVDISNLTIEHLNKHVVLSKEKGYVSTYRKIQECQNLKDSFRTIKDVLIGQNNTLEALQWHKLELYMSELEIKYRRKINVLKQEIQAKYSKQQDQKENDILEYTLLINQENKIKNIYNKYQLKAYRLISDHHSDLSKIFFFTLSMFGLYMFIASLLAYIIDEYKTSFDFSLFDENIFKYIFMLLGNVNFYFLSNILMCLCVIIVVILVLLAICCLVDLVRTNISFQCNNILEAKLYIKIAVLMFLVIYVMLECNNSKFVLLIDLVLYCILFVFLIIFMMNLKLNSLIFIGSLGTLCFIYQPSIAAPFLGIISDDVKNFYLIKSIHDLNNNETNELYSLFIGRNIQTNEKLYLDNSNNIYNIQKKSNDLNNKNPKQVLLEHKDVIKEEILKGVYKGVKNSSLIRIQKSVAKDQIMQSINAIYYIVLFLSLFSLQKTARRNSIVPS